MRTAVLSLLFVAASALAGPSFTVSFDASLRDQPATGRLVVYLVRDPSGITQPPAAGPFWEDPQPLYGIDVRALAPGAAAIIDDHATSFPMPLGQLPAGKYRAQAVLDLHHDNSEWKREPGNLYSDPVAITVGPSIGAISLSLTH